MKNENNWIGRVLIPSVIVWILVIINLIIIYFN
jgi:hypothetical protein